MIAAVLSSVTGFPGTTPAQAPAPLADEFQVNTYTTGRQESPKVAIGPGGEMQVVWWSYSSDADDIWSIQGQMYDPGGNIVGGEFQVNTYTTYLQKDPSVAAGADGNFLVVWASNGSPGNDTDYWSIQGQRFDPTGVPLGAQMQINAFTTGNQEQPAVAASPNGEFVVVWQSYYSDSTDNFFGIHARRMSSDGDPLGDQFQVNSYVFGVQRNPSVEFAPSGEFIVVWGSGFSPGTDQSYASVQGRRFTAAGAPMGSDFQVNTYTYGYQRTPDIGVGPSGDFVVVWASDVSPAPGSFYNIHGQRFSADAQPFGAEFQINSYTTGRQVQPALAAGSSGETLAIWTSQSMTGTGNLITGQLYQPDGLAAGGEFQINNDTTSFPNFADIAASANGQFIVSWQDDDSAGTDSDNTSIQARLFEGEAIVSEDMETGDLSGWSSVFSVP